MTTTMYLFGLAGIFLFFISIILLVLGMPFSIWGIKYKFLRGKLKDRMGLVWVRSKGDSFGLPKIVNVDEIMTSYDQDRDYPLVREAFEGTKWFGCPSVLFDAEDSKNVLGLCYHEADAEGQGKFYSSGSPVLSSIKPPVCLDPALFKAITVGAALTSYVKNFMQKYQTQLYILIAIAIGIGIAAYFGYEMYSSSLPNLADKMDSLIAQCNPVPGIDKVAEGVVVTR